MKTRFWGVCTLGLCMMLAVMPASAQVFVVPGGAGNTDGTSWADAYGDVQSAVDDARAADEDVWVAGGTYELDDVIVWPPNVAGYGGFAGDESALEERDFIANETILDALGESRVIRTEQAGGRRIDGFTITGGANVTGDAPGPDWGAGLHFWGGDGSNTVANCWIVNNNSSSHGGGAFLQASHWVLENNIFENNSGILGGAIFSNDGAAPTISNSMFIENNSQRTIVSRAGASPTITNSVFLNNVGTGAGSAVQAQEGGATATIEYCTFYGNVSEGSPASVIFSRAAGGVVTVNNSIIWGNQDNTFGEGDLIHISNTIVEGGHGGGMNVDPLFVDAEAGDLRLQEGSPAIGVGNNWPDTDIEGLARPQGPAASIGAYEYDGLVVAVSGPAQVIVDSDVQFILEHNAEGEAEIIWEKDGEVLEGEVFDVLLLTDVSEEDSGQYTVTVIAENGEASASITLNVVAGLPLYSPLALLLLVSMLACIGIYRVRRVRG